ncbi:MAG: polysaccharide deacetylase family protein [Pelobacteraceae bacterium]
MTERAGKILGTARTLAQTPIKRLLNCIDPPVIVLLYHRVTTLPSDPEMLAVTPDNFRAQMRHLKETVPLVRFEDDWTRISKPAVSVTFDDGYADNAREALPILEETGVPATFFVSTGTIGTGEEFWWHELERIILEKHGLPGGFTLDDGSFARSWPTGTPEERQDFYQGMVQLMNAAEPERRDNLLVQLRHWAQTSQETSDMHRAMTVDELRLLDGSNCVTIGAHTVTHSRLSSLSKKVQQEEIAASKEQLETWLDRKISVFSYPFGRRSDYTGQSIELCRDAGFTKAAANFPGQAHRWTDPYQIPRHLVRNWPVEIFVEKLLGFWTR